MESIYPKFSLYGGTNECARTNTLLLPLSEVSTGAVSLDLKLCQVPFEECGTSYKNSCKNVRNCETKYQTKCQKAKPAYGKPSYGAPKEVCTQVPYEKCSNSKHCTKVGVSS